MNKKELPKELKEKLRNITPEEINKFLKEHLDEWEERIREIDKRRKRELREGNWHMVLGGKSLS